MNANEHEEKRKAEGRKDGKNSHRGHREHREIPFDSHNRNSYNSPYSGHGSQTTPPNTPRKTDKNPRTNPVECGAWLILLSTQREKREFC